MTVSSAVNKVSFNGDDTTTVFAYSFKIFDQDDLIVILRSSTGVETVKTITTDYTVSGVGSASGGNVTMLTAPATGETLTILREQPLTQGLDLVPNDPFPAGSLEDALDKLVFMMQQQAEELDRCIKLSKTNTMASTEFTVSATDRADEVFAFDAAGELSIQPLAVVGAVTLPLSVSNGGTNATDAATARSNLGTTDEALALAIALG